MISISSIEILSRFIIRKSWIRSLNNTVKHDAFLPKDGETSVFRIYGIAENEIWDIGEREVAATRGHILGRADITASIIRRNGLEAIPKEPPIRHAVIANWPSERSEQKLIAMELAAEAQLRIRQESLD